MVEVLLGGDARVADQRAKTIAEHAHGAQPIRIAGSPADIGHAVAYFASDLSRFVTGRFLAVDGGLTVGPRTAWDETAAVETWSRMGLDEEQVRAALWLTERLNRRTAIERIHPRPLPRPRGQRSALRLAVSAR